MNEIPPEVGVPFMNGIPRNTIALIARTAAVRLARRYGVRYRVRIRPYGWLVSPILAADQ